MVADIEAMFYQVKVDLKDKDSLRFLWGPKRNFLQRPIPHCMKIHLFGASSSLCYTMFSFHQIAIDFHSTIDSRDVVLTVQDNFYADNFLSCVHDSKSGHKLINDIKFLLEKAGFWLTKLMSNSELINCFLKTTAQNC